MVVLSGGSEYGRGAGAERARGTCGEEDLRCGTNGSGLRAGPFQSGRTLRQGSGPRTKGPAELAGEVVVLSGAAVRSRRLNVRPWVGARFRAGIGKRHQRGHRKLQREAHQRGHPPQRRALRRCRTWLRCAPAMKRSHGYSDPWKTRRPAFRAWFATANLSGTACRGNPSRWASRETPQPSANPSPSTVFQLRPSWRELTRSRSWREGARTTLHSAAPSTSALTQGAHSAMRSAQSVGGLCRSSIERNTQYGSVRPPSFRSVFGSLSHT